MRGSREPMKSSRMPTDAEMAEWQRPAFDDMVQIHLRTLRAEQAAEDAKYEARRLYALETPTTHADRMKARRLIETTGAKA